MRPDVLYALILFCFVSGVTPGPNNLMLMSSGVNFGFRRTLPHLLGVVFGFSLMVALIGLGLNAIFARLPWLLPVMRYAGVAYMVWLAWRIARSGPVREGEARGRPLGFFGAAAFQWINPKAWFMAISALTAYSVTDNYAISVAAVALTCLAVGLPSSGSWVLFGSAMRKALSDPRRVRPFNLTMAALLVASVAPALFEG
jgi:threonine/homoserine/homoserine lactone efflux protein